MNDHVEAPLKKAFASNINLLEPACQKIGGTNVLEQFSSASLAYKFTAFPKIPVILVFWDKSDGFEANIKLLFDETIIDHLDIEAIMFLSEQLRSMLLSDLS